MQYFLFDVSMRYFVTNSFKKDFDLSIFKHDDVKYNSIKRIVELF